MPLNPHLRLLRSLVLLLSFLWTATGFAQDSVTKRALALLPPEAHAGLVELPPELRGQADRYFKAILSKVALPGDEPKTLPTIVFVDPWNDNFIAFVYPQNPEFIFWNPRSFVDSPNLDVDTYVAAHEMQHLQKVNKALKNSRGREYDADLSAIALRLFRVGQRDPLSGEPADAIIHPDSLINFFNGRRYFSAQLKSTSGYQEEYINSGTLSAGVRVLYANERSRRRIPSAPAVRTNIAELLQFLDARKANGSETYVWKQVKVKNPETEKRIEASAARLQGDPARALAEIDGGGDLGLSPDFWLTLNQLIKLTSTVDYQKNGHFARDFETLAELSPSAFLKWTHERSVEVPNPDLAEYNLRNWLPYTDPLALVVNMRKKDAPSGASSIATVLKSLRLFDANDSTVPLLAASRWFRYLLNDPDIGQIELLPESAMVTRLLLARTLALHPDWKKSKLLSEFVELHLPTLDRAMRDEKTFESILHYLRIGEETIVDEMFRILMRAESEVLLPGLRAAINADPGSYPIQIEAAARTGSTLSLGDYVRTLTDSKKYRQAAFVINEMILHGGEQASERVKSIEYILNHLVQNQGSYIEIMDELLWNLLRASGIDPRDSASTPQAVREQFIKLPGGERIAKRVNQIVARDPHKFFVAWKEDQLRTNTQSYQRRSGFSSILMLIDWPNFVQHLSAEELVDISSLIDRPQYTRKESEQELKLTLLAELAEIIERGDAKGRVIAAAASLISRLPASSPQSQHLISVIFSSLKKNRDFIRIKSLIETIPQTHFTDSEWLIDTYIEAMRSMFLGEIHDWPEYNLLGLIEPIRATFDPQLASRMLIKLATIARADYEQKDMWTFDPRQSVDAVQAGVDQVHVWNEVFNRLDASKIKNLIEALRGSAEMDASLKAELVSHLEQRKVVVSAADVEGYVRQRFAELEPFHRAGIFQILLEGASDLLQSKSFRKAVFRDILRGLPDNSTREVFLDLWEAGMEALPKSLRPVILSIVLSESGKTGTPERALVTLFSKLGPLEQKFGQMLALSNLPESYRAELRKLWDGAQTLGWWEAWELLLRQKGDVRQAGYTLTRILHSGSTEAFLEITHKKTGQRYVIPVYRDGIEQAVRVGEAQLRKFTQFLATRNRARYGYLPLLAEDSVRTIRRELDADQKRSLSLLMVPAYQRAAHNLGWTVESDGTIQSPAHKFASVPFVAIPLPNGKIIFAQHLADGMPLKNFAQNSPEQHASVTRDLLRLEMAVLDDPASPVDKDRMPGQNIFSPEQNLNYILDHGQAEVLPAAVHAQFKNFVHTGFAGDIDGALKILADLTGLAPDDFAQAKTFAVEGDVTLRPLTILAAAAPVFENRPENDPAKLAFFGLLHGARAYLRLLQWAQSEGIHEYSSQVSVDVRAGMSVWQKTKNIWQTLTGRTGDVVSRALHPDRISPRRMERAYSCDDELSPKTK